MTDLEQAVQAVESGLLPAIHIAGRSQERALLCERMARENVLGSSVALIEGGKIAWAGEYGVLEAGGGEQVTGEALFQTASISKLQSAIAALRLVQCRDRDGR